MASQRKSEKQWNHQNLPRIPYFNHHDAQDIKTRKGTAKQIIVFCARAISTGHDIAHNTKTTDNTGINKYSKYKALIILSIRAYFRSRSNEFKTGKLKQYFHKWKELTSDKEIIETVWHLKLEFLSDSPVKHNSYIPQFSKEDESVIDLEIQKPLAKCVITRC